MSKERNALQSDVPFDAIVEQSVAGMYVLQDECFVYCNGTWAAMLGRTPPEVLGRHLRDFVPPNFLPEVLRLYHKRLEGDPPSIHFVTRGIHRLGHELRIEVHGSRVIYRGRPAVFGVGIDITERWRYEQELERSRERLRDLGAYTRRKLEEQRLEFAREIHDVLGGTLTSLKMDATRILRRAGNEELRDMTRSLIALTQKTIDDVRQISQALRPAELDRLDLSGAIARELAVFAGRAGVQHQLEDSADTLRLPPRRAFAIYRIFQEALTNVARHAEAQRVTVVLSSDEHEFVLQVADDGRGFDPLAQDAGALGLLSMRERAREIDAEFDLASAPGGGTRVTLRTPLL